MGPGLVLDAEVTSVNNVPSRNFHCIEGRQIINIKNTLTEEFLFVVRLEVT